MNIEDLEYALAAAEINESITDKRIQELEEKRLQKFALKGQERQKNPKTEEQISLEEEKQKYTIEKNNLINLIGSYNSLKNNLVDNKSIYSKYSLEDFNKLKNEKEEELDKIKKRIKELEEARIPAFKLKDAETKLREKTEEQISLENSIDEIEADIKKLNDIVRYAENVKRKISMLDQSDMTKYAKDYQTIIYEANKANLPTTLIINLMRQGLSSEFTQNGEKLTNESKEKLREKINKNIENIRNRKAEDQKRINELKQDAGIDIKPVEEPITNDVPSNNEQKESVNYNNVNNNINKPIFVDEERVSKDHSWMDTQNASNLGHLTKLDIEKSEEELISDKLSKLSNEDLLKGIKELEKRKDIVDSNIVKINLNTPWENNYELMEKYIRLVKKIKMCNDELEKRNIQEEQKEKTNSLEKEEFIDIEEAIQNSRPYKKDKLEKFKMAKEKFDLGSNFKKLKEKLSKMKYIGADGYEIEGGKVL